MNEKKILETIEENLDKLKRVQISKIKHLREYVLNFYKDGNLLDNKILLTSFYMGYREYPKCLNDTCENKTNWLINRREFTKYCSTKCSNSDPKKDETTVKNNLEKYGVPRASMTEASKTKLYNTNIEKFGFKASSMHPEIKNKAKITNIEKYNYVSSSLGNIINLEEYSDKDFIIENFVIGGQFYKDEFMKYFGCSQVAAHNTLNRLGIIYNKYSTMSNSSIERKVKDFLIQNNINFISHYRDNLELDFFLQDYNIGIECDGLYYHSFGLSIRDNKTKNDYKNKHKIKKDFFWKKGIQVLFLREDEILDQIKFKIWGSIIKMKIGLIDRKIFARKTEIKIVSEIDKKEFLKNSHIQGNCISQLNYGLYYEKDLVAIMTFAKPDKNKNYQWELKRFAVKPGCSVIGGASKLLKHFEKVNKPETLLSYQNLRWSIKYDFYIKLGFDYIDYSDPAIFIIKNNKVYNRLNFQKHKLKDIENFKFDENLTGEENLLNNGYRLLWDVGNFVFLKKYDKEIN